MNLLKDDLVDSIMLEFWAMLDKSEAEEAKEPAGKNVRKHHRVPIDAGFYVILEEGKPKEEAKAEAARLLPTLTNSKDQPHLFTAIELPLNREKKDK